MERRIIVDLVAGDDSPDLPVRFTGLDLADYTSIEMNIELSNGTKFSRTVTPDGTDTELGYVTWTAGDLVFGTHAAEFEFTSTGPVHFTLPRKYPLKLSVRKALN
jgi:hypothetical protein